jgi:surface antigen
MRKTVISLVTASLLVSSCANTGQGGNEATGTIIGGIAGGLAGLALAGKHSNALAVLLGVGIGAFIGNRVGALLDDREKQAMADATQQAAEFGHTNERVAWSAPAVEQPDKVLTVQSVSKSPTSGLQPAVATVKPTNKPTSVKPTATSNSQSSGWTTPPPAPAETASASGWIIPKSDAYQKDGRTCRDMTQVAVKNGQEVSDDVTLCKQVASDGTSGWVIPDAG